MNTIIRVLGLTSAANTEKELLELVDEESDRCATSGDWLGAGEWSASRLTYGNAVDANQTTAKVLAHWSCPSFVPNSTADLISSLSLFDEEDLGVALVGLVCRHGGAIKHSSAWLEKGYVNDGAREYSIGKVIDALNTRRRELGEGKWRVVKARKDNLCVSYVDSELKSGASLAREILKRASPGKSGDVSEISNWIRSRVDSDPVLVIVDDFSGTGTTISKGISKWLEHLKDLKPLEKMLNEKRIMVAVLYAFGDAIDAIKLVEPRLQLFAANTFGVETKAFDEDSNLFDSKDELDFARDVMLQIGRELVPQMPLGYGDQGI